MYYYFFLWRFEGVAQLKEDEIKLLYWVIDYQFEVLNQINVPMLLAFADLQTLFQLFFC